MEPQEKQQRAKDFLDCLGSGKPIHQLDEESIIEEKPIIKKPVETQTYKFMDCKTCDVETRFVSTLSPKGDWVCCRCQTKVAGKPFKLEIGVQGHEFKSLRKGEK